MIGNDGRIANNQAPSPIMSQELTDREAWFSTLIFALLGLAASIPLLLLFQRDAYQYDWRATGLASGLWLSLLGKTPCDTLGHTDPRPGLVCCLMQTY